MLVPHIPGEIPSCNDWSEMRWILVGPSTDSDLDAAFAKLRTEVLEYPWDVYISDEYFLTAAQGDKVNLGMLDVFPALYIELFHGQLLPAPLIELHDQGNVCGWITQQAENVRRPIMDQYLMSLNSGSGKRNDAAIYQEMDQAVRNAWVSITPQALEFIREFLSFLDEFLVQRFGPGLSFERDLHVASIWLGESFETFLREKKRDDLRSLLELMRRTKAG